MILNADGSRLFVACSNSDVVSVIDTRTDEVVETIAVNRRRICPSAVRQRLWPSLQTAMCSMSPMRRKRRL
jgi:YVTN family beta-propeller protein